jgi:hypothetical protein
VCERIGPRVDLMQLIIAWLGALIALALLLIPQLPGI